MGRVRCTYCGSTWHIEDDHKRAKTKGGVTTVPSCQKCNRMKRDKSVAEFLDYTKQNDPARWRKIKEYQKRKRSDIANMVRKRR